MSTRGRVRVWDEGEGWGVIDSEATPGGCWTHYSSVAVAGYKVLRVGAEVRLTFESPGQDGFSFDVAPSGGESFRTVEAWPADQEPVREGQEDAGTPGTSSVLTLTFDGDTDSATGPRGRGRA